MPLKSINLPINPGGTSTMVGGVNEIVYAIVDHSQGCSEGSLFDSYDTKV